MKSPLEDLEAQGVPAPATADVVVDAPRYLGAVLGRLSAAWNREQWTELQARGHDVYGFAVFQYLDHEPIRLGQLAEMAGVTKQAMSEKVSELVSRGYLSVEPDPRDRRSRQVALTDRGWELKHENRAVIADMTRRWEQQFGTQFIHQLTDSLLNMDHALNH